MNGWSNMININFENKKYSEAFVEKIREIKKYADEYNHIILNQVKELHALNEEDFKVDYDVLEFIYHDITDEYLKGNFPKHPSFESKDDLNEEVISAFDKKAGGMVIYDPFKSLIDQVLENILKLTLPKEKQPYFEDDYNQGISTGKIKGLNWSYKGKHFFFAFKSYPFWPRCVFLAADLNHCYVKMGER